jgi:tetratricopeptide (TPR) repeat protein
MLQSCPACHSDNRDVAKFCDQCGNPLSPEAEQQLAARLVERAAAAGAKARGGVNWSALLMVIAIALGTWYFIRPQPQPAASGAGGPSSPAAMMGDVQKQLEEHKGKLDKNPLDLDALREMYSMYGQIGQGEKVRPYLDKALAAWKKQFPKPTDEQKEMLASMALSALEASDLQGAAQVLKVYHEAEPENLGIMATLGNIYYELKQEAEAIEWYGKYLAQGTPEQQGGDYYSILVDQATMHLHLAKGDKDSEHFKQSLASLTRATTESPKLYAAWYNLGEAHKSVGEKSTAIAAYRKAAELAENDPQRKWEAENQIALLEGKAPPPRPQVADPHAGLDMGGTTMPTPPPGTPNPHGEGGIPMTPPR